MSEEKSISAADLKAILVEVGRQNKEALKEIIDEIKKPTALEQKKLDEEAKAVADRNQERKENAAGILAQIDQKRQLQRICSHKHRDGHSHCVFVSGQGRHPDYILCQVCQGKIRFGVAPENYNGDDIYDTNLYNRLFQELPTNDLFS